MPRSRAEVTETELAILNVLWQRGATSVREIVEALYSEHSASLHATVNSLLDRLLEKNYVECDKSKFAHTFRAVIDRETYVGSELQRLADSHFSGSLVPMLLTLTDRVKLTKKDREAIRRAIGNIR